MRLFLSLSLFVCARKNKAKEGSKERRQRSPSPSRSRFSASLSAIFSLCVFPEQTVTPQTNPTYLYSIVYVPSRAEKEKNEYYGQLNDLRAGVDHITNEKVYQMIQFFDCDRCCKLNAETLLLRHLYILSW